MIKTIYVDSDGVLADFDGLYEKLFGPKTDDATLWKNINSRETYFSEIEPYPDAFKLLDFLYATGLEVKILTATGWQYDRVSPQKKVWFMRNFAMYSDDVITVKCGKDKAVYANSQSILIDDMMKNIDVWEQAGGIGIWHNNVDDSIDEVARIICEFN